MLKKYGLLVAILAATALTTVPASAQSTRYVRIGGADGANTCASVGTPCLTIGQALTKADAGDTIDVGAGTFAESVSFSKGVTLQCAQANVNPSARTAGGGTETILNPSGASTSVIEIRTNNVAINGCDIDGALDTDVWAGLRVWNSGSAASPDNISGIDITNNFIRNVGEPNPAGTFNYAYGIWTMGGGSDATTRGTISDLLIDSNSISFIGDGNNIGAAAALTAGAGMYLKSISGASAGLGATVTNNVMDDISNGTPSIATSSVGGTEEQGLGITVLQDSETSTIDKGALLSGNTYGDGDADGPYLGAVVQTTASAVIEALANFGAQAIPMIINLAHPDVSDQPLSVIDTSVLSTPTTAVFSVDNLSFSTAAGIPSSLGYFRSISDAAGASTVDQVMPQPRDGTITGMTLTYVAPNLVFTFANGDVFTILLIDFSGAGVTPAIVGSLGDDNVTLDLDLLEFTDVTVALGNGNDTLVFGPYAGACAPLTTIEHSPVSPNDGAVRVIGTAAGLCAGFNNAITYTGLEPIDDSANFPINRIFNFDVTAETIVLNADGDGASDNNVSFIDSEKVESYVFGNPTGTLVINASGGDDTLNLGALDTAALVLPAITVTVNGDTGADRFNVTATNGYADFDISGGSPAICPGDVLNVIVPGTETADFSVAGTVTFAPGPYDAIGYTGIEAVANFVAELSLATSNTLFPGDQTSFTLTVTNGGPSPGQCIIVANAVKGLTFTSGPVLSTGTIVGDDWIITSIPSGGSATLTGTVFVNSATETQATVTSSTTDADATNNAVTLIGTAFKFPAKAHAQSALVYQFEVAGVTLERVILGLFQGYPGGSSAVLCRIPEPDGVVFTVNPAIVAESWRECGQGLPYPLYVNDMYHDLDTGRIWLASWGSAGLYYSDDAGLSWTASEPSLAGQPPGWLNVYAITEDSSDILYISANNGKFFRSLNGGTTWQEVSSLPGGSSDTPWSLEAHLTTAGTVYAGTFGKGVWVTDDFGLSWAPLVPSLAGTTVVDALTDVNAGHVFDLEFSPDDPSLLYAGTAKGLYRIDIDIPLPVWVDQGLTVVLDGGPVVPEVRGLAFSTHPMGDGDDDLFIATWGFGVYVDDDPNAGGTDQIPFTLRGMEVSFVAVGNGVVYTGTSGGGFYQNDAGAVSTTTEPVADQTVPTEYNLSQNYPNPFNPVTTIQFALPEASEVQVVVFDILGRPVRTLIQGTMSAGNHEVQFDASGLPSGTYLYVLNTPESRVTKHMILLK
ncbi:MAG: hypothetical protein ACI9W4_000327 [Rhodothermales bacterium]|jgi:hypothetical protein